MFEKNRLLCFVKQIVPFFVLNFVFLFFGQKDITKYLLRSTWGNRNINGLENPLKSLVIQCFSLR